MILKLKTNPYNFLIPVKEENQIILYNSLTSGLEILNFESGQFLLEKSQYSSFEYDDEKERYNELIRYLYDKEYLIDHDKDIKTLFSRYTDENQYKFAKTINLTIGTTITCNMGCSYCFEFVKPNHTLKDDKVKKGIKDYIEDLILKSGKKIETLSITWYGGEPLINVKAIEDLTVSLTEVAQKYNLKYVSNIITNGIYLTEKNIKILEDCNVHSVQITIDGAKETHDKKRPLKQVNKKNYEVILENLSKVPLDSKINFLIRVNIDKEVAASIDQFLDDLNDLGIWPNRFRKVSFDPAWLRTYDEIDTSEEELDKRMNLDEFFDFKMSFRKNIMNRFNSWSDHTQLKIKSKLKWDLPTYQTTCATWASPISMTIDPNGYIHKCWETIHDDSQAPASVFDGYNAEKFTKHSSFNRFSHNEVCTNCKILPICDTITCSHEAIKANVPVCSSWKYKLEDYLKEQYINMLYSPETISRPQVFALENTGHSAK